MKYFLVFLISAPAFACKLIPQSAARSEKRAAIALIKSKNSSKEFKARKRGEFWIVRSVKPSCMEYQVKIKRHPDCKLTSKIVSETPCS